jgi:hypothetical protein
MRGVEAHGKGIVLVRATAEQQTDKPEHRYLLAPYNVKPGKR